MAKIGTRPSGIVMARNVRLEILRRTREILSDASNWTQSYLRKFEDGKPRYCVLGAVERAAYDLGYATEDTSNSFDESDWLRDGNGPLGYRLGNDISLNTYVKEEYGAEESIWRFNDNRNYEAVVELLDKYITEVAEGRAREPQIEE